MAAPPRPRHRRPPAAQAAGSASAARLRIHPRSRAADWCATPYRSIRFPSASAVVLPVCDVMMFGRKSLAARLLDVALNMQTFYFNSAGT